MPVAKMVNTDHRVKARRIFPENVLEIEGYGI